MDKGKTLGDFSNEELWELFPIIITGHNEKWKEHYLSEEKILIKLLSEQLVRVHHIGSTAIPGLPAKPTIDILVEIKEETNLKTLIAGLESIGYIYSSQPQKPSPNMMFMKGYTIEGFRGQVFHLHIRYPGDWDELYFRDYLLAHPEKASEYGQLKLELKDKYEFDRDSYTNAKTAFIKDATLLGRKEFLNKYR